MRKDLLGRTEANTRERNGFLPWYNSEMYSNIHKNVVAIKICTTIEEGS